MPCLDRFPMAATTAVGVANMKAQGQNTIMTVSALETSWVNRYVAAAITKTNATR